MCVRESARLGGGGGGKDCAKLMNVSVAQHPALNNAQQRIDETNQMLHLAFASLHKLWAECSKPFSSHYHGRGGKDSQIKPERT